VIFCAAGNESQEPGSQLDDGQSAAAAAAGRGKSS